MARYFFDTSTLVKYDHAKPGTAAVSASLNRVVRFASPSLDFLRDSQGSLSVSQSVEAPEVRVLALKDIA